MGFYEKFKTHEQSSVTHARRPSRLQLPFWTYIDGFITTVAE